MKNHQQFKLPPALQPFLSSNDPLPEDASNLKAALALAEAALRDLLTSKGSKLPDRASEQLLRRFIDDCKNLLSSNRRLPAELVEDIFLDALGHHVEAQYAEDEAIEPTTLDTKTGLHWVLGQVCRRWRSVVKALPVWSYISLVIDGPDTLPRRCLEIFQELQTRSSGGPPLAVRFWYTYADKPTSLQFKNSQLLFQRILSQSRNIQSIDFHVPDSMIPLIAASQFSSVKDVKLETVGFHVDASELSNCFANSSSLRSVSFNSFNEVSSANLPWRQLSVFDTRYIPPAEALQVLRQARNLVEHGLMGDMSVGAPPATPADMILLPCMRKISLMDHNIIAFLVLPALSEVEIYPSDNFVEALSLCVRRSSCTITTLTCRFDDNDPIHLMISYLPTLSSVTSLSLHEMRGAIPSRLNQFVITLHPNTHNQVLPLLEKLQVSTYDHSYSEFDGTALANMIRSRRRHAGQEIQQLESFHLTIHGVARSPRKRTTLMQALYEEGMDIWVAFRR